MTIKAKMLNIFKTFDLFINEKLYFLAFSCFVIVRGCHVNLF